MDVLPLQICNQGKNYLKIHFQKVHVTKDKRLRLLIFFHLNVSLDGKTDTWTTFTTENYRDKFGGTIFQVDMTAFEDAALITQALENRQFIEAKVRVDILDNQIPDFEIEDFLKLLKHSKEIRVHSHGVQHCCCQLYENEYGKHFTDASSRKRSGSGTSSSSSSIGGNKVQKTGDIPGLMDGIATADSPVSMDQVANINCEFNFVKDGQSIKMPALETSRPKSRFQSLMSADFFNHFDLKFLTASFCLLMPSFLAYILESIFDEK